MPKNFLPAHNIPYLLICSKHSFWTWLQTCPLRKSAPHSLSCSENPSPSKCMLIAWQRENRNKHTSQFSRKHISLWKNLDPHRYLKIVRILKQISFKTFLTVIHTICCCVNHSHTICRCVDRSHKICHRSTHPKKISIFFWFTS